MTLKKIWAMGLINDNTEVWVRDPDLHLLAHGNWYQADVLEYLDHELECFTWQDDGNFYIDLNKELTYEEFIELAKENYTKGGDIAVECWERGQFEDYVKMFGGMTETKALQMFRQWKNEEIEQEAMMFSGIW